jgi:hypothetical protein
MGGGESNGGSEAGGPSTASAVRLRTRRTHRTRRAPGRRRLSIATLSALVLGGLLPVVAAQATAGPASATAGAEAAAAAAGDSCTGANPPNIHGGYVLPAWNDGAGWSNPDQYESITSGDIDGDGRGELIGRNGNNLEIFTWASPKTTPNKAYNPNPGQWSQVVPTGAAGTAPTFAATDGWWDLSRSSTFRLADLDGQAGDELVVRTGTGLTVYRYLAATKTFGAPIATSVFPDSAGWGQSNPGQYETIMTGNVDGNPGDEIIGRGADGLETWKLTSGGLTRIDGGAPALSNDLGWNHPQYWRTIRTGDVDGDGKDEVVGRGVNGLQVFDLDVATETWTPGAVETGWSDGVGWTNPVYYATVTVGDVNADGRDDVVARSSDGITAVTLQGSWKSVAPHDGFTDSEGFNDPENASTVQVADVLPAAGMEVIGRADGGVVTYALVNGSWTLQAGEITAFSNTNGFGTYVQPAPGASNVQTTPPDYRYSTIRPVTVASGQPQLVIGRDNTGIRTFRSDGTSPSSPFPAYTDLHGLPNNPADPPDLDSLTPEGRAYWYVNAQASTQLFGGVDTTILEQFRTVAYNDKWAPFQTLLLESMTTTGTGSPFDPADAELDKALNVSRPTYNSVLQDVGDWSGAVSDIYQNLLGPTGMQALVDQAFLANVGYASEVQQAISANPALMAFIADLLWGFIAAVGVVAFFAGASEAAIAMVAALGSVAGAGVAGGMGLYDPNGGIDTIGTELEDELRNQFCGAQRFFENSFDQIVQDYGLLVANDELVANMRTSAPAFGDTVSAMTKAQELWVWQRFGNSRTGSNMWIGWCDFGPNSQGDCEWDKGAANTWSPPEDPNISYRLVGEYVGSEGTSANCAYDVLGDSENQKLIDLKPDVKALDAPRQTDTAHAGKPLGTDGKDPVMGNIGITGWRLGTERCDDGPAS